MLVHEPVDMVRGVPQSYYVDEFSADGIMQITIMALATRLAFQMRGDPCPS